MKLSDDVASRYKTGKENGSAVAVTTIAQKNNNIPRTPTATSPKPTDVSSDSAGTQNTAVLKSSRYLPKQSRALLLLLPGAEEEKTKELVVAAPTLKIKERPKLERIKILSKLKKICFSGYR
jgi:hypothetical protein